MKELLKSLRRLVQVWPGPTWPADLDQAETLPLAQVRFVVLDIETTGLDVQIDEVLALGAIRMIGSRIRVGETFYRLVQPAQTAWRGTVPIHRILPGDVAAAPDVETVLAEFSTFCAGHVLVGHMVRLDRTFLTRGEQPAPLQFKNSLWLDTGRVARWLAKRSKPWPRSRTSPETGRLSALAWHYHIPVPLRHHALADAFITAQVWQHQLIQLKAHRIEQMGDLARIGWV